MQIVLTSLNAIYKSNVGYTEIIYSVKNDSDLI